MSLTIEPGVIYGLIGRNGAGKTTLLSILTAQNTHEEGIVTYGGQPVWENEKALADLCFSRELSGQILFGQNTYKVRDYLRAASAYYPHWDKEYADELVRRFGLDVKKKICKLSKEMCIRDRDCTASRVVAVSSSLFSVRATFTSRAASRCV